MHYLTELAEKLVVAYQDQDHTAQWHSTYHLHNRRELIESMRYVLEQEVAKGCLRFDHRRCAEMRMHQPQEALIGLAE